MGIFDFIAEQRIDEIFDLIPFPRPPRWRIEGKKAVCEWDKAIAWNKVPSEKEPGKFEVHIVMPPPIEDLLIHYLHENGWKRGGWWEDGSWQLYAYVRRDGMEIRIKGTAGREYPDKNNMIHFYAPEPPPVSRRKSFKADYEEYMRKSREDEW